MNKWCPKCEQEKSVNAFSRTVIGHDGTLVFHSYCKACQSVWVPQWSQEVIPPGEKKCKACGQIQPLDQFWKNKSTKDGRGSVCKSCKKLSYKDVFLSDELRFEKRCNACNELKPLTAFTKDKRTQDGYRVRCKECVKNYVAVRRNIPKDVGPGQKYCPKCEQIKDVGNFYKVKKNKDGLYSYCKECDKKRDHRLVVLPSHKKCPKCSAVKSSDEYYFKKTTKSNGLSHACMECEKEDARRRVTYSYRKSRIRVLKPYGLTLEEYAAMLEAQGGVCAACGKPEDVVHKGKLLVLAVDHCHTTGSVRGLLCARCNRALGELYEDPERARGLLKYIEERCLW